MTELIILVILTNAFLGFSIYQTLFLIAEYSHHATQAILRKTVYGNDYEWNPVKKIIAVTFLWVTTFILFIFCLILILN